MHNIAFSLSSALIEVRVETIHYTHIQFNANAPKEEIMSKLKIISGASFN